MSLSLDFGEGRVHRKGAAPTASRLPPPQPSEESLKPSTGPNKRTFGPRGGFSKRLGTGWYTGSPAAGNQSEKSPAVPSHMESVLLRLMGVGVGAREGGILSNHRAMIKIPRRLARQASVSS